MDREVVDEMAEKYLGLSALLVQRSRHLAQVMSQALDQECDEDQVRDSAGSLPEHEDDLDRQATEVMGSEYCRLREWVRATYEEMSSCHDALNAQLASTTHRHIADEGRFVLDEYSSVTDGLGYPEGFIEWLKRDERDDEPIAAAAEEPAS